MICKIGIDGGGTKTELILTDESGEIVASETGPGCNPSLVGAEAAGARLRELLEKLRANAPRRTAISQTLLCMAGHRSIWTELAATLDTNLYGQVETVNDSVPVLELGTGGRPGIVLHAGTGSFVAARDEAGDTHYAGGLGWKIGDPGSGYDLGRRGLGQALMEWQGWAKHTGLIVAAKNHFGVETAEDASAKLYAPDAPSSIFSQFAPPMLELAARDDQPAKMLLELSIGGLVALAAGVYGKLFMAPGKEPRSIPVGLSGPILNHAAANGIVESMIFQRNLPFALRRISEAPIEGVRRMLGRAGRGV